MTIPLRWLTQGADQGGTVPVEACMSHRCAEHAAVPSLNNAGPDNAECAMCVAETMVRAYEKEFEKKVFWPMVESARSRLNLLAVGAGEAFMEEARATLNAAGLINLGDDVIVRLHDPRTGAEHIVEIREDEPAYVDLPAGRYLVEVQE